MQQAGFLPSNYKTSYYRSLLLSNTEIDLADFEFGYLAIILRVRLLQAVPLVALIGWNP